MDDPTPREEGWYFCRWHEHPMECVRVKIDSESNKLVCKGIEWSWCYVDYKHLKWYGKVSMPVEV